MRFLNILAVFAALAWTSSTTTDGLQDVVTWDPYSVLINDERVYILSGEFHYQRMPVPELWFDIFQKFRANGLNTISVYFFWSYHSPSKDVYDFTTAGKDVQRMIDYAKEAGIYIIARAGPYCNAETNAGGLALWGSDGSLGVLRTDDETYHQSWLPFISQIGAILAKNQITNGGPIILNQVENELQETVHDPTNTLVKYMEQLETAYRAAGIIVPFTHNEKGKRFMSWSTDYEDVGGAVNMYGLDSYPGAFSCTDPSIGFQLVRNYYQWFSNYSYTQPNFFPEFEGGGFTPWGGSFYDDCAAEHDPAFADVYYKNNVGQRGTLLSLYMGWGGTNWGHSAAPVVYTSYDYSAPLRETLQIQDKFSQIKLIGLFTRVSDDLLKTYMVGNGTGYSTSSSGVWSWVLRNPDTEAGFTTLQQAASNSTSSVTFDVYLNTTMGAVTVPSVTLNGRQSKILVTDYSFGSHTLLYSSVDILTYGVFKKDVLVLYLEEGQVGEFAFKDASRNLTVTGYGNSNVTTLMKSNATTAFRYTQGSGQTVLKFSNDVLVYLLDIPSAWRFWAPPTGIDPYVKPDGHIFVTGPYLVRNATVAGSTLYLSGDSDNSTTIEVTAGTAISSVVWNNDKLDTTTTAYGALKGSITGAEDRVVKLPLISGWQGADSLPEILPSHDDSTWTVCNKTSTLSPIPPVTLPVLFSSDYGYYTGAKIYRGHFSGIAPAAINITCSGGLAFGWTAWLNGALLGGNVGNVSLPTTSARLAIAPSQLSADENIITVVVDYHGHDQTSTAKGIDDPRGILGAQMYDASGSPLSAADAAQLTWKIRGNAGGSANIDPVRGPMNEGGLYAERLGWFLPGFDVAASPAFTSGGDAPANSSSSSSSNSSSSSSSSPLVGRASSGISFYVADFTLDIDPDLDVPLGIELAAPAGTVARAMLWVNGYQYGKFVPHIGPQTRFPVPVGVLDVTGGKNTVAVSLWAMTDAGARLSEVKVVQYGKYVSGLGVTGMDLGYLRPGWTEGREVYA